ncbi:uncharacterized protein [Rutidosis leptorrhynchoides]|uniref:uncharacterized protein n=1 Tax=Rutidosis leptorrhynchoides TaxID=125765 RepID=UPI003A99971C
MTRLELFRLKSMWGNFHFDYALSLARGYSGGIISMWDPNVFVKERIWSDINYVFVKGRWIREDLVVYKVNIYAPQSRIDKPNLWNNLSNFMANNIGEYIMFGDWNAVRIANERSGTDFCAIDASNFNDFINANMLHEIPLGGLCYTWRVKGRDTWIERPNFDDMVKTEWAGISSSSNTHITVKLRNLKGKLKSWIAQSRCNEKAQLKSFTDSINDLDSVIDSGQATEAQIESRNALFQQKDDICKFDTLDSLQKARIKWDIEGDENSKFFRCSLKHKRKQQTIQGLMIDGNWVVDPVLVKNKFFDYYSHMFDEE